ncbi:MAG TPA: Uma2 family endonuclease [Pyrinomonadaceae bacterium]|jgi:Uma2 family endonuclease|nr:Uma2 family endonuclease [Pyrinomonadaceae bacterium]
MSSQPKTLLTVAEYLAIERDAEYKSEYYKGEVFAFAGASLRHNRITANVLANIHSQLRRGPCSAFTSDLRISIPQTPHYAYADAVIVCGQPKLDDDSSDNLLNPTLIVEVLSPSTERFDRGKKFESYQRIASLLEYVLVSQDMPRVEQFLRQQDGRWLYSETSDNGPINLTSIDCELSLNDIYDKVEF